MENLRGNLSLKPSNKTDFIFQALEWTAEDIVDEEEDVDSEDEGPKAQADGFYTVRAYGMNEKSESVALKIRNFCPYFYVKVPFEAQEKFNNKCLRLLVLYIKEKVYKKFQNSLLESEIVLRKEFYGFTNEEKIKFVRFRFQSLSASRAYSKVFQEKIRITMVSNHDLYYQLYESNIDPILRLCHIQEVKPVGWVKLKAGEYTVIPKAGKETKCNYEFICEWNKIGPAVNPNIGPMIVASFDIECVSLDGSFPKAEREGDRIIQIGTTAHYHGQKNVFLKHIITLGQCNPIEGVIVESYDTEEEVLLAWTKFITILDPDIITGYNIWGFDLKYLYDRSVLLGIMDEFCQLGRIRTKTSVLVEKQLQSSALGQNFFYILEMEGRVQVDIMKVVQRDYKLDMYKLDFVAETFLKSNKVDLSPKQLFAKYKAGGADNICEIAVYCVQDCELCNRLMNKLEIITNNVGMGNVCHVPFYWLFLRGQGVKIYSLVSRQCRKEGFLLKVLKKGADEDKGYEGAVVLVATPGIYMVPVSVNDFASLYPSSMISENISHDSIVFVKVIDNNGTIINMHYDKPGWYSMNRFREYDKLGTLDEELKKIGYKTNYIESINYEGFYGDLTKKAEDEDYEYQTTDAGKKILGKTICCYVEKDLQGGREEKSVIPRILENLLWERRVTRASAFYEEFHMKDGTIIDGNLAGPKEDEEFYYVAEYKQKPKQVRKADVVERKEKFNSFQQSVLDGLQLAFKVTANSLYGQVGAPTSPIYFKELASSTTATGRKLLKMAKDIAEENFPGATCVYGDTDSVFLTFNKYWENVLGLKLEGKAALEKSIELCKQAGKMVTAALKKPHDLEYEKTFFPFIQLAKKRYVGNLYEDDPDHFKQKSMGIVLKRRDNAPIVKDIYGGIVDIILNQRDVKGAVQFFRNSVRELLEGKADLSKLVITKTLRAEYKNPDSIAHKALADRMTERDPGNKPQSNDRIPFIFIQTKAAKGEKVLQGDKVEHPDYIKANLDKCKPDFMYYLDHQIKVPCIQLLALALEDLNGYRANWMDMSIINRMKEKGKNESEINMKIMALREQEAERLLIGDILRIYNNKQGNNSMITDFFIRKPGPAPIDDDLMDLVAKKTETIGIDKIKEISKHKKEEAPKLEEKILQPPAEAIKKIAKMKQQQVEEKVTKKKKSTPQKSEEEIEEEKRIKADAQKAARKQKVDLLLKSARKA